MKTKTLLLILAFPFALLGQVTNHFSNLDSKWYVAKTFPDGNLQNPNFVATTTNVFGFQGDTLINNELWFKLYSTNDSLFLNGLVFKGLIRTTNNRVLFLDTLNQLDTLYDFHLNVGDSVVYNFYGTYSEKIPLINIDSIQINGFFHKRFRFAEPAGISAFDLLNEVWIEGVGSIHGPIFPNGPVKFSTEMPDSLILTCTHSNSQEFWKHPSYNVCYLNNVLGVDNKTNNELSIYPNPFQDNIRIKLSELDNYRISIFNSKGQKVIEKEISSDFVRIDLTDFDDGIYFLTIANEKGEWATRLVKKRY